MSQFTAYKMKMPDDDDRWFYNNANGSAIGPYPDEETAGAAAHSAKVYYDQRQAKLRRFDDDGLSR